MIITENDGVSRLLNVFENVVRSRHPPSREEIDELLASKSISFIIKAYSRWPDFSEEDFVNVIANLASANPVGQGTVIPRLEEGFRSCLSQERIDSLREKLQEILRLDFTQAERIALQYLPPQTQIQSTIYLTIDTYNPGMVFEGNVSLSILNFNPENFNFQYLAHELHHSGFHYWIRRNPKLKSLALKGNASHQEIAVNMILHLLSEGMANYYCTPNMTRMSHDAHEKHNQKIKKYESSLNQMLLKVELLLSDCVWESASVEECKKRLMNIILDPEGILPPVHFIGARIIERFDKDPAISRDNIINLCKKPSRFLDFYVKVYKKYGMPKFSKAVIKKLSALL